MNNVRLLRPDLAPVPSAVDAEQALVGAVLMENRAYDIAATTISAGDFHEPIHGHLWSCIGRALAEGRIASPLTIAPLCGHVEDIGGLTVAQYLARLVTEAMPVEWVENYARTIKEMAIRRKLIALAEMVDADARNMAGASPSNALSSALARLDEVRADLEGGKAKDRAPLAAFAADYAQRTQDRMNGDGEDTSLRTGLREIDRTLGGFQRGGVTIVAGRPGMGKTAVAVDLAWRLASHGHAGAFFSIEMGADQIMPRFFSLAMSAPGPRVDFSSIMRGEISRDDLGRMVATERGMRDLPLFLDTIPAPTVSEIQSRCRSAVAQLGRPLDFVVVDYLGLVSASTRYQGQRTQEVGEVSRGMKALAKSMGPAIILLAQLNRQNEGRADKRPELADLRDSGEIEQDAEAVLFAYREAYYLQNKTDADSMARHVSVRNHLELIIAKNRHGPTGNARLYCDIGANLIDNLEDR